jgi:hypothetical protein
MTPTENVEQAPLQENPLTKEELETKKLRLEIQDMERPFWRRPAHVLAALPTVLILITLFVGSLNGFLQTHVTKLISENRDLVSKREELIKQYENAKRDLATITHETQSMSNYEAFRAHQCEAELEKLKAARK